MVWPFASRPARQPDVAASAEPRLPAYALTVELHRPFHAALRDVRSALEAEELQLWQEQDLTALLGERKADRFGAAFLAILSEG